MMNHGSISQNPTMPHEIPTNTHTSVAWFIDGSSLFVSSPLLVDIDEVVDDVTLPRDRFGLDALLLLLLLLLLFLLLLVIALLDDVEVDKFRYDRDPTSVRRA
jgi:hypothetical protein